MSKLLNLIAILIFLIVAFVLGVVLYGSTKSVTFKKHSEVSAVVETRGLESMA